MPSSRLRPSARDLIATLELEPLGFEGGYYIETYRSASTLTAEAAQRSGPRSAGTAIYYMLTPESRSLMHRLATDEVYHFYLGDPVDLLVLHPDGTAEQVRLGPDVMRGESLQHLVPAGTWQGSRLVTGGEYALMGTTMCPGFDLADFELGRRRDLVSAYPQWSTRLEPLTPEVLDVGDFELTAATKDLLHAERRDVDALRAGLAAEEVASTWTSVSETRLAAELADPDVGGKRWYVVRVRPRPRQLVGWMALSGPNGGIPVVDLGSLGTDAPAALVAALEQWALGRG